MSSSLPLPSIMVEMSVDQSTAQWLTTGFTLVNAIMIPITAFLQDRFSTRKLFVFSMSLFAVGTLLAAVGLNFPVLLGGRLVQAAGAGILMPVTMTVLMLVFPVDRRGSAMGIFGLVIGNEGEGVGRLVREKCDFTASIPMKGDIDSLNASVAAGVMAFEIVRQRMNVQK